MVLTSSNCCSHHFLIHFRHQVRHTYSFMRGEHSHLTGDILTHTLIHHQSPSTSFYTTSMQNNLHSIILHTNHSQHIKPPSCPNLKSTLIIKGEQFGKGISHFFSGSRQTNVYKKKKKDDQVCHIWNQETEAQNRYTFSISKPFLMLYDVLSWASQLLIICQKKFPIEMNFTSQKHFSIFIQW